LLLSASILKMTSNSTQNALLESLESLRPKLLQFALLQLRDRTHAEDAVQETMLAVLENLSNLMDCHRYAPM